MTPLRRLFRCASLASLLLVLPLSVFAQGNSAAAPGHNRPDAKPGKPSDNTPAAPSNPSSNAAHAPSNASPNASLNASDKANSSSSEKPKPHSPNPNASPAANAVQAVLEKFDASRDKIVNERKALIDKLAVAKDETEREAILAQLKEDQKSVQDEKRATAKEIRAELQNLRRQRETR